MGQMRYPLFIYHTIFERPFNTLSLPDYLLFFVHLYSELKLANESENFPYSAFNSIQSTIPNLFCLFLIISEVSTSSTPNLSDLLFNILRSGVPNLSDLLFNVLRSGVPNLSDLLFNMLRSG